MADFVSETITPHAGTFATAAMAAGGPGLPSGFTWRGADYSVVTVLETWKESGAERGRLSGERYLRRHCYRLAMSDGSMWEVYFLRQAQPGSSPRRRWFLLMHTPAPRTP